jgi:hypothetical protein
MNGVEEIREMLAGQNQPMGMGMSGKMMHAHSHGGMYGRPPMGGLFFLLSLFLIASIITTMMRMKMLSSFRMHGMPGMGRMGGMPFSRHC